jgi:hypothetical protein
MSRSRSYWLKGERCIVSQVFRNRGRNYSLLSAISLDGPLAVQVFEETVVGETVTGFLKKRLFPSMNPFPENNSVLILDNASVHNKENIRELADLYGIVVEFLPPYSPGKFPFCFSS